MLTYIDEIRAASARLGPLVSVAAIVTYDTRRDDSVSRGQGRCMEMHCYITRCNHQTPTKPREFFSGLFLF